MGYHNPYINFLPNININAQSYNTGFMAEQIGGSRYGYYPVSANNSDQMQVTTMMTGEEGGTPPMVTSMAEGEEGGFCGTPDVTTLAVGEEGGGISFFWHEDGGNTPEINYRTTDVLQVAAEADRNRFGRIGSPGIGDGKLTSSEINSQITVYQKQIDLLGLLKGIFGFNNPYFSFLEDKINEKIKIAGTIRDNFLTIDKADNSDGVADGNVTRKGILNVAKVDGNIWNVTDTDLGIVINT